MNVLASMTVYLLLLTASHSALAAQFGYELCPGIKSVYVSDPKNSRALVINYNPVRKTFVVLRCGERDDLLPRAATEDLSCHVFKEGTSQEFCQEEVNMARATRVVADLMDAGTSAAISGGISVLGQASRSYGLVRGLQRTNQCPGTNLMLAMAYKNSTAAKVNAFFDYQTDVGPGTTWVRLLHRKPEMREHYIFSSLDQILNPGSRELADNRRGVDLNGPAYLTARRNNSGVDQLVMDSPLQGELCNRINGTTIATPQPAETSAGAGT